ncbi:hypothetical protein PTNB73_05436 [Pyrenophora teres f. teres]|nr:hypothetical protein PTNB85_04455 [Pyrenophora teres f. teres]KAE8848806.1 hypothetical protein HRS9122_02822 [Pyrenophora teres f. teres]KAE8867342.1 hypothetical protein PTNB73_05436 [Pyrenophora teres f. teres]CAE7030569.1 Fungal-trans multi-domain protein [Pyrenophora teres f. teres]
MQRYDQSDDGARDDVSATAGEHDAGSDYDYDYSSDYDYDYSSDYDVQSQDKDDNFNDTDKETQTRFNFTTAYADPKLSTLLNGPQWQEPDPRTRRAPRVNYSLTEQSPQTRVRTGTRSQTHKQKKKKKSVAEKVAGDSRKTPPLPDSLTLARCEKDRKEEPRTHSFIDTFVGTQDHRDGSKPRVVDSFGMPTSGYIHSNGPATNIVQEYSPFDTYVASYQDFKLLPNSEKQEVIRNEAEENGLERPKGWNVSFHYNPHVEYHHFGSSHPMKPWRLTLTKQLVVAYGLEYTMDIYSPRPASMEELALFHERKYLDYLSRITPQNAQPEDPLYTEFGFGGDSNDCPVFDGLWNYVSLYTGATISAAQTLVNNTSDIAINWSGGLHHAKKNLASGFCYVNDIVIAIQHLLTAHPRVLYIDIDVHHGDGVEQAFESTDKVFTLSYHKFGIDKHGWPFFPGTGSIEDTGPKDATNPGKAHSLNIPIDDGIDDEQYQWLFKTVTGAVVEKYNPTAIVLQSGADSLGGDRLGRFNLNIKAHGFCVQTVKDYGRPLLLIGGGGYTPRNVARTWCHETAVCVGAQLHNELPSHVPYLQAFQGAENGDGVLYPDLHNIKRHENLNSQAKLHKLVEQALENLRYLEGAPSVNVDTRGIPLEEIMKIREMIDRELEEENEERERLSAENSRRKKERNVGGRGERRRVSHTVQRDSSVRKVCERRKDNLDSLPLGLYTMSVERRPSQQSSIGPGQPHGSSSTSGTSSTNGPSSASPTPNPRSCVTCRRRKVKCDKKNPCSNCVRANIECVFPAPGRAPRKSRKPADAELLERLRRLEGVVTSLNAQVEGHEQEAADRERRRQSSTFDDLCPHAQSSSRGGGEATPDAHVAVDASVDGLENRFGRLVVEKGRSRYINNSFWASLNNEVEDLKAILIDHSDDEDDALSPDTCNLSSQHHGFIFGYSSSSVDMQALHPGHHQATEFWQVYKENVEALVKVLHIPTHEPIILDAFTHLDKVDRGLETLLFAIYYGAATSSTPEHCLAKWGEDRGVLLNRYRFGLEQALARANFLHCDEVIILQAFVVFMVLLRRNDDARNIWTLTGLVVRISQTLGIHRDGSHFGLPPFQVEMRRRLWWQVCILDARSSEDHGCDPTIVEAQFDTKMPLNLNDTDLHPDMTEFPQERQGFTDMTFCLLRFEIANILRRIVYIPPGPNKCTDCFAALTIEQKEKWITDSHQSMENKYLKNCDMNIPLCWVTATISRLIMSKMWLIVYHPYQRKDGGITLPQETKDKLFITSLENVEYSLLLETEARTMKWGWLFRTYVQWHAIAFLLSELCVRTKGEAVEPKAKAAREREMALERASIAIHNVQFPNHHCSFEFPDTMAPKTLPSVTSQYLGAVALDNMLRPAASKLGETPFTQHSSWPNSPTESRTGVASSSQNSNGMSKQRKLPDGVPNNFSNNDYILNNDPERHFGDFLDFGFDHLLTEVMGSGATTGPDAELEYAATKAVPLSNTRTTSHQPVSTAIPAQMVANNRSTFGHGMLPSTSMDFRMDANENTDEAAIMDNGDMDWALWDDMVNQYRTAGLSGHTINPASTSGAATLGLLHWL